MPYTDDFLDSFKIPESSQSPVSSGKDQSRQPKYQAIDDMLDSFKVNEPAQSNSQQSKPDDRSYLQRIGQGFGRGVKDVLDTAAEGLASGTSYVADKLLPESIAKPIRESAQSTIEEGKKSRQQYDVENPASDTLIPNAANVARVGGQIAATLPAMPAKAFTAIRGGMGALPTLLPTGEKIAAPLINRLGASAIEGGLGGAIFGGLTSSTNDKSLAENVGEGAISGAIGGPLITGLGAGAKVAGQSFVGKANQLTADLAERADQLGIPLKASQVSNSKIFKKYDQMSSLLPFSGATAETENQLGSFTRAVSKTFGEDTDNITPQLIQQARNKIGQRIENVAANSTLKADNQFINDLRTIYNDAKVVLPEDETVPVQKLIDQIIEKFDPNNHTMSGETYNALTKLKGIVSKAQNSASPNVRNSANDIRSALDDLLQRNISPNQLDELLDARRQYKSVMTIKKLAEEDPSGQVSPLKLMQKVLQSPGGKLRSGELGELADIGRKFFPQMADSGTPIGTAVLNTLSSITKSPISGAAATYAAMNSGYTLGDMAVAPVALLTNRLVRKGANSEFVKNIITNSAKGNVEGISDQIVKKAVPYSSLPVKRPLEAITSQEKTNQK